MSIEGRVSVPLSPCGWYVAGILSVCSSLGSVPDHRWCSSMKFSSPVAASAAFYFKYTQKLCKG